MACSSLASRMFTDGLSQSLWAVGHPVSSRHILSKITSQIRIKRKNKSEINHRNYCRKHSFSDEGNFFYAYLGLELVWGYALLNSKCSVYFSFYAKANLMLIELSTHSSFRIMSINLLLLVQKL